MLLTLVVGDIQIPYFLWVDPSVLHSMYHNLPSWYPAYAVLGLASNIAIIIGIWKMKRWGAYLLALYFVAKAIPDMFYLVPDKMLPVFATTIIGAALWFWAIYRKWEIFD